jgi:hypothetical protein
MPIFFNLNPQCAPLCRRFFHFCDDHDGKRVQRELQAAQTADCGNPNLLGEMSWG